MPNLKELREQRQELYKKLEAVPATDKQAFEAAKAEWEAKNAEVERAEQLDDMNRRSMTPVPQFSDPTTTSGQPVTVNVITERKPDTENQIRKDFRLIEAMRSVSDQAPLTGLALEMFQEADKEARALGVSLSGNVRVPGWLARGEKKEQRDMTVGTTTAGGHTVATDLGGLVPILNPRLVTRDMGATYMTGLVGNLDLPRHTTKQTAAWAAEQGSISESDPVFDKISLTPKRLGAITDYSKTLLYQSSVDVENLVRSELSSAVAIAVDIAALHGRGAANQPSGIVNASGTATNVGSISSGVGTVTMGTNGGVPTWGTITSLETAVSSANGDYGTMAYLTHPAMVGKLKNIEKASSTGMFLWGPPSSAGATGQNMGVGEMNGYRAFRSTLSPGALTKGTATLGCYYIYFGNWKELVIAQWGGLDMVVDPFTQAATGNVRVVVQSWWDVAMLHPASFAVVIDATLS